MANRLLIVNIRNYVNRQPRGKRRNRTIRYVREKVAQYTKMDIEKVKIDKKLNERITKFYSRAALPVKMNLDISNDRVIASPFEATIVDSKDDKAKKEKVKVEKKKDDKAAAKEVKQAK